MFSIDEQKFIVDKIEKLKEDIRNIENIDSLQFERINKKLDHIEEMVSKLNNIDWKNLFIGTIMSMMAGVAIPSDAHQHLWNLFKGFFSGVTLLK